MKRGTFFQILPALLAVIGLILGLGQGCSPITIHSPINALSGNGGGYGGMTSLAGGPYGTLPGPNVPKYFYEYGVQTNCASYPSGWETVGPDLIGILSYSNGTITFAASACASSTINVPASNILSYQFDSRIAIYQDAILFGASDSPPTAAELIQPLAYCVQASKVNGTDVGIDLLIYQSAGQTLATLNEGQQSGISFEKSYVQPFSVQLNTTNSNVTVSGPGLELDVSRSGNAQTVGTANLNLDGKTINLATTCYLTTP